MSHPPPPPCSKNDNPDVNARGLFPGNSNNSSNSHNHSSSMHGFTMDKKNTQNGTTFVPPPPPSHGFSLTTTASSSTTITPPATSSHSLIHNNPSRPSSSTSTGTSSMMASSSSLSTTPTPTSTSTSTTRTVLHGFGATLIPSPTNPRTSPPAGVSSTPITPFASSTNNSLSSQNPPSEGIPSSVLSSLPLSSSSSSSLLPPSYPSIHHTSTSPTATTTTTTTNTNTTAIATTPISTSIVKSPPPPPPSSSTSVAKTTTKSGGGIDRSWQKRIDQLVEYKKEFGHVDVPSVYPPNKALGTWVMNQRQQYRKLQMGSKSSMTQERVTVLEALAFKWYVGKGMRSSATTNSNANINPSIILKNTSSIQPKKQKTTPKIPKKIKKKKRKKLGFQFDSQAMIRQLYVGSKISICCDLENDDERVDAIVTDIHYNNNNSTNINNSNNNNNKQSTPSFTLLYTSTQETRANVDLTQEVFQILQDLTTNNDENQFLIPKKKNMKKKQKHKSLHHPTNKNSIDEDDDDNDSQGEDDDYQEEEDQGVEDEDLLMPVSSLIAQNNPTTTTTKKKKVERNLSRIKIGMKLAVYWPDDSKFYPAFIKSKRNNGQHLYSIVYEDGASETVNLQKVPFKFIHEEDDEEEEENDEHHTIPSDFLQLENDKHHHNESNNNSDVSGEIDESEETTDDSDDEDFSKANSPQEKKKRKKKQLLSDKMSQTGKERKKHYNTSPRSKSSTSSSSDVNVLHLSDDVLHNIVMFVTSDIKTLASTCLTCKRLWKLIEPLSIYSEPLLQSCYANSFGTTSRKTNNKQSWRDVWDDLYQFRWALKTQTMLDDEYIQFPPQQGNGEEKKEQFSSPQSKIRKRIGILTEKEEMEAIHYDNPHHIIPTNNNNQNPCIGYFGMETISVFIEGEKQERIIVWGDYPGVCIFDSIDDVLYEQKKQNPTTSSTKPRYQRVAQNEGQVLTIIQNRSNNEPCFFLGCAPGMVLGISATKDQEGDGNTIKYHISSRAMVHSDEVTALALLTSPGSQSDLLVSGSVDGKVYLYPTSSLEPPTLAFDNRHGIFSLAATQFKLEGGLCWIICAGDKRGNITLWICRDIPSWDEQYSSIHFERIKCRQSSSQRSHQDTIVSQMSFVHNNLLITGNNFGDLRVWELKMSSNELPDLNLRFSIPSAHVGTVECMHVFGNTLCTTGGNDGLFKGWDITTGDILGSVGCHTGTLSIINSMSGETTYQPSKRNRSWTQDEMKSAVIGMYFVPTLQNLATICRDGTIHSWDYGKVNALPKNPNKINHNLLHQLNNGHMNRRNSQSDCVLTAAAALSTLSGRRSNKLTGGKIRKMKYLRHIMTSSGDEKLKNHMRNCIIQAAYEHANNPIWNKVPDAPFLGADGQMYEHLKKAFALFSGMRPCTTCRNQSQGVYTCRLILKHESSDADNPSLNSMDTLRSVVSPQKPPPPPQKYQQQPQQQLQWECPRCTLLNDIHKVKCVACHHQHYNSGSSSHGRITPSWECHKCHSLNPESNKRCRVCISWRDGKRNSLNRTKQAPVATFTASTKKDPPQQHHLHLKNHPWNCHRCGNINRAERKRCINCQSWKGGKREDF